jgi:hypothetical protein
LARCMDRDRAQLPPGLVIGVTGGCGGLGASRFAAVLATAAAQRADRCVLADLDPAAGGLDVLLGAEAVPGARWSQLRLAGGVLDGEILLGGLASWGRTSVLACDRFGLPAANQVGELIDAARSVAPVVLDLARHPSAPRDAGLGACALVVVLCAGDLAAITAARTTISGLGEVPVALIARGARSSARRTAELIGGPLAARLPPRRRRDRGPVPARSQPTAMRRVADGLLAGLADRPGRHATSGAELRWVPGLEIAS